MIMKDLIQNLRQKPKGVRLVIALVLTIIIFAPIFLIWFFSISNNLGGTFSVNKNTIGQVEAQGNKESLSSFVSVGSAIKSVAGGFWASVSSILTKPNFEIKKEEPLPLEEGTFEEESFKEEGREVKDAQTAPEL
jgi:hypothetical protein